MSETVIQIRRDTLANWNQKNPLLAQGEIGIVTDRKIYKVGDGTNQWVDLDSTNANRLDPFLML